MKKTDTYKLILASKSPRRKELLKELGLEFSILDASIDESFPETLNPEDVPVYLAKKKLDFALQSLSEGNEIVISADTIVICDKEIMEKPINRADAFEKLSKLSDKTHVVITGVCIGNKSRISCFYDITEVFVDPLSEEDIKHYIDNFDVFDKAGAYGIQDWLGTAKISAIKGSYTNVMGLPTQKLWKEFNAFIQK